MSPDEDRLAELESRLAFQDDTIQALDQIVTRQQRELDLLGQKLAAMTRALQALKEGDGVGAEGDERPPHY